MVGSHTGAVRSIAVHARGGASQIVSAAGDGAHVWYVTGNESRGDDAPAGIEAVAAGTGEDLVVAGARGLAVWRRDGTANDVLAQPGDPVRDMVTFTDTGRSFLACASGDDGVTVWDLRDRRVAATLRRSGAPVRAVAAFGDGLIAGGTTEGTVCIWRLVDGALVLRTEPRALDNWVRGLVAYRGEEGEVRLASVGQDRTVRIWDAVHRKPIDELEGHKDWVMSVAVLAGEPGYLVSGGDQDDRTVRVWDAGSHACVAVLKGHTDAVRSVTGYRNDAGVWRIASGGSDCTVRIWNPLTGALLRTIALGLRVRAVRPTPGGGLAVGTAEGHLVIELPAGL